MEIDAPTPPPRPTGARIDPEDYVTEEVFPSILELIEESSDGAVLKVLENLIAFVDEVK
jgi:hypothetical protein